MLTVTDAVAETDASSDTVPEKEREYVLEKDIETSGEGVCDPVPDPVGVSECSSVTDDVRVGESDADDSFDNELLSETDLVLVRE